MDFLQGTAPPRSRKFRVCELVSPEFGMQLYGNQPLIAYTDGSVLGDVGGIGVVLARGNILVRQISRRLIRPDISSSYTEVWAAMVAITEFRERPFTLMSDADFVAKGINRILTGEANWFQGKAHAELWQVIADHLAQYPGVAADHIEARSGNLGNDLAHRLAGQRSGRRKSWAHR